MRMNKRQAKKRRMKFIAMNDYPSMPFSDTQCPYCGWESCYSDPEEIRELGGEVKCKGYGGYFDGTYSGHQWTMEFKCPICKTKFEYDDSDV